MNRRRFTAPSPGEPLDDLVYSASARRTHHPYRLAVSASTRSQCLPSPMVFRASGKAASIRANGSAGDRPALLHTAPSRQHDGDDVDAAADKEKVQRLQQHRRRMTLLNVVNFALQAVVMALYAVTGTLDVSVVATCPLAVFWPLRVRAAWQRPGSPRLVRVQLVGSMQ